MPEPTVLDRDSAVPAHRRLHVLRAVGGLLVWIPATAFFVIVAASVGTELAGQRAHLSSPILTMRQALVTAAYSLGGGFLALAVAWLALPRTRCRGLGWAMVVWVGVTAILLGTRQVSGWPLLLAASVATGIGFEVNRRLLLTVAGGRRPRSTTSPML